MDDKPDIIDIEEECRPESLGKRGQYPTYLVVADETDEFNVALHYACRLAAAHKGHVSILYPCWEEDFHHWGNVEARMRQELREQAEKFIWNTAKKANDLNGQMPSLYIREEEPIEAIRNVIDENQNIVMLVLGGGAQSNAGGPMMSQLIAKGFSKMNVPLVVVPGHLDPVEIDSLTQAS